SKFEAQALEIIELKARVKFLEDRQGEDITHSKDDAPIKGRRFGMKGKQQLKDLVERVKLLEDREGVIRERSGDDAPIKGRRIDEEEVATKRVSSDTEEVRVDEGEVAAERASEDTEEMATVLTTMDASTVLASGAAEVPTGEAAAERVSDDTKEMATVLTSMDAASVLSSGGVQVVPTAAVVATATVSIPTGSGVVPIASLTIPTVAPIFATATTVTPYIRRKGKEKMVDTDTPKKKKRLQEQIDVQFARELEDELEREAQRMNAQIARDGEIAKIHAEEELQKTIEGLDMTNEVIAKHLNEYEEAATELSIGERIELINELVKYQDHHSKILQYQAQQRKPQTKKQKRDYYMAVIRSYLGWKVKDFKGMTFEQVEAKFNTIWKQIEDFIPMGSKEEAVRFNRKGIRFEQEGEQEEAKKIKTSEEVPKEVKSTEEVPKEKVKEIIQLVPVEEVYVEALQVKHPIVDWKVHIEGHRSYWQIISLGGSSASYQF
nr:hypothetical protein [Tanacetum cinerariifolium]